MPIKYSDWENNIELSKCIFNLFADGFYIVRWDSTRVDDESIKDKLEYYSDLRDLFIETGQLDFSKTFFPRYHIVKKVETPGSHFPYDIFQVSDEESLNFFLSCSGGDNDLSIFSKDYDIDFLSTVWRELDDCNESLSDGTYIQFHEYLAWKYADYIKTKKTALIGTGYEDTEDYLLISDSTTPDISILNEAVAEPNWFEVLPDILKRDRLG